MKRTALERKPRPRKKPGSCQMPKCRRLGNRIASNDRRMCDKHAADDAVGQWVKRRDGRCVRCGIEAIYDERGRVTNLDWAHVVSRRYGAIRWSVGKIDDPWNNSVALCRGCHRYQGTHPLEGDEFFRDLGIHLGNLRYLALHDPPQDPDDVLHWLSGETQ